MDDLIRIGRTEEGDVTITISSNVSSMSFMLRGGNNLLTMMKL